MCVGASKVVQVVKSLPADAGDARDAGVIPGSGRSFEKEMTTHSGILAWTISWTEKPGGLQSMGSQSRTQLSDFTYLLTYNNTDYTIILMEHQATHTCCWY